MPWMPWKFIRASHADAVVARDAVLDRVGQWWQAFAEREADLAAAVHRRAEGEYADWMREHLDAIDPRLRWEFGPAADGGQYLVLTPGDLWHLRPMVQSVVDAAPALPGWQFHSYRPPLGTDEASARVRAETGHNLGMATIAAQIGSMHRADVLFQTRLAATDEAAARQAATLMTRLLVGERLYAQWVGDVDVAEPSRQLGHDRFQHLARLLPLVQGLGQSVISQLPAYPYWGISRRHFEWTGYKFDPRPADDYGGQTDLVVGTSAIPEMRKTIKSGRPFFSSSFSRQNEAFCYLKIDAGGVGMDDRMIRRQRFEEPLEKYLRHREAGRIVGSGTGLRYIYFDLAVADLVKAVECIRKALLPLGLPDRAWLLFYDSELSGEWLGLRSGSPEPPEDAATTGPAMPQSPPPPAARPPSPASDFPLSDAAIDPLPTLDDDPFLR